MNAAPVVHVRYRSWGALQRDAREQIAKGGMFVAVDIGLKQFTAVVLHVVAPDGKRFELPAQVVTVVPGAATAVQLAKHTTNAAKLLREHAEGGPAGTAIEPGDPLAILAADLDDESSEHGSPFDEDTSESPGLPKVADVDWVDVPFEGFASEPAKPAGEKWDERTQETPAPLMDGVKPKTPA